MKRCLIAVVAAAALAGCSSRTLPAGPTATMDIPVQQARWEAGAGGQQITSAHYCVYTNSRNTLLVRYLPGFMEAAYRYYVELTGLADQPVGPLAGPMPVYLMNSREDWASLTTSVVGPAAGIYLSIQAGGYCYRGVCVFWDIGNLGTLTIASHEGLHQFFHHRLKSRLPTWVEEGMCTLAEGYEVQDNRVRFTPGKNLFRFRDLRVAIVDGHWMPLAKLLGSNPSQVLGGSADRTVGYYGQLWALASLIRSREPYRAGLARLLEDARTGKLQSPDAGAGLFTRYISDEMPAFERDYRAYAKTLVGLE